jgi:RHS repeat-associated protein
MIRPSNRASIRNISDYSPFGVQLSERTISSDGYRFGFQGQEMDDEIKGEGNSYDFGARMYDSRVGRWLTIDPAYKKYVGLSSYAFTANNPIMYIEIDGMVFDLGYLSESEKKSYLDKVTSLKNSSKMFNYYYTYLEKSNVVYTIHKSPNNKAPASFVPDVNYVVFKNFDEIFDAAVVQELFHAFQFDLMRKEKIFESAPNTPLSNIELEGDIMTTYVADERGASSQIYGWEGELGQYYEITSEVLNSEEYLNDYSQALDRRIDFYKDKAKEPGNTRSYASYTAPRQDFGPEAIMKVVKEIEASSNKLEGPRQQNGDYYEN